MLVKQPLSSDLDLQSKEACWQRSLSLGLRWTETIVRLGGRTLANRGATEGHDQRAARVSVSDSTYVCLAPLIFRRWSVIIIL